MRSFYILFLMMFAFCTPETSFAVRGDRSSSRANKSRSERGGGARRGGTSKRKSSSRGRIAIGTSTNRTRLRVDTPVKKEVVEEAVEELPEVEIVKKTVVFKNYTSPINKALTQASVKNSRVGLDGAKRYSYTADKCVSGFQECNSQMSVCRGNFSACFGLSPVELEEKTWFCQKTLMKKCAPDTHETMFERFATFLEEKRVEQKEQNRLERASNRPICLRKIEGCLKENCANNESSYGNCFTFAGLSDAKSYCEDVIASCETDYPDMMIGIESKISKAGIKIKEDKAIFELACFNAFGNVRNGECMRMITVKYDNKTQMVEIPLSAQPSSQLCTHESLKSAEEAWKKKKKRKIAAAVGIGAAVGFGAGALTHGVLKKKGVIDEDNKYIKNFISGTGKGLFTNKRLQKKLDDGKELNERQKKRMERRNLKSSAYDALSADGGLSAKEIRQKLRKIKTEEDYEDEIGDYEDEVSDAKEDEEADFIEGLKSLAKSYGKDKPKRSQITKDCKEMCEDLNLKYMGGKSCVSQCKTELKEEFYEDVEEAEENENEAIIKDFFNEKALIKTEKNLKSWVKKCEKCPEKYQNMIKSQGLKALNKNKEGKESYYWDGSQLKSVEMPSDEDLEAWENEEEAELEIEENKEIAQLEEINSEEEEVEEGLNFEEEERLLAEEEKDNKEVEKNIRELNKTSERLNREQKRKQRQQNKEITDKEFNRKKINDFQRKQYISNTDFERYKKMCRGGKNRKKKCIARLKEIYEGRSSKGLPLNAGL